MTHFVYIGTYTDSSPDKTHRKEGIYVFRYDLFSGDLTFDHAVNGVKNPSFLGIHPNKRFLYAVNELGEGQASAFAVEPATGKLTFLNSQPTDGSAPCYVCFDPIGKWLLVPNYGNGTVAVFPILPDGRLGPHSDYVEHNGIGPDAKRQEQAHAHSIIFDPTGKVVLVADLGIDHIMVYRLDTINGKLIPNNPPWGSTASGAGPRHMAFHPNGRVLYSANELDSTVTAFYWRLENGELTPFQTLSTLPEDFKGHSQVADIHFSPNGKFLYISNRGHQSLAIYRVAEDGKLSPVGFSPTGGDWPRNFAVLPGDRLLAANEHTGNLVAFSMNSENGQLTPTGQVYLVPKPVCVLAVEL